MSKSILYRLFGFSRLPSGWLGPGEAVVVSDDGLKATTTWIKFRAPGIRRNWKRQWHTASIAMTKTRLVAFRGRRKIMDIPLIDERFDRLGISADGGALIIAFDAADFMADSIGQIEYRFTTPKADEFIKSLTKISEQ